MLTLKISRSDFKSLPQNELATFAENVLAHCQGKAEYAMIESQLTELQSTIPVFNQLLIDARERAISVVVRKREYKAQVLDILSRIASILDAHAKEESFITKAGFRINAKTQSLRGELPPPQNLTATSVGNRGEVLLQFALAVNKAVRTNTVEYSLDAGQSWKNGTYATGTRVLVDNLPSMQQVLFRVRSIGTFNRVSAWSEPAVHVVL